MNHRSKSFLEHLHQVVQKSPLAPAVECPENGILSYLELWAKAGVIETALRKRSIGSEDVVAISIDKSIEFLVSLLGIWRSGAAFVVIPPEYPESRKIFLISDASVKAILTRKTRENPIWSGGESTDSKVAIKLAGLESTKDPYVRISLDYDQILDSEENTALPLVIPTDNQLAYVCYTSGSNGRPKGVAIEYKGLMPLLRSQVSCFRLCENSRSLFLLNTVFDAAVSDICTAWFSGACLCLPPKQLVDRSAKIFKIEEIPRTLDELKITYVDLPPAFLPHLEPNGLPECLQTIVVGGEPCPPEILKRFARKKRVVNVYGPTEATVCTSLVEVDPDKWDCPLIGDPIEGVNYLVKDDDQIVGEGATGELLISGDCLAREYLNDPKNNAEKFIVRNGVRYYRTGDLVRILKGNKYQFIGRVDRQIKFQGKRIEPEEIESILNQHPMVLRSAVLKVLTGNQPSLVAFTQIKNGNTDGGFYKDPKFLTLINDYLKSKLQKWMRPSKIVFLPQFPLTRSGKIDFECLRSNWIRFQNQNRDKSVDGSKKEISTISKISHVFQVVFDLKDNQNAAPEELDFLKLGGDSLKLISFQLESQKLELLIRPEWLTNLRTAQKIAKEIDALKKCEEQEPSSFAKNIQKQIEPIIGRIKKIARKMRVKDYQRKSDKRTIFLTGATGFLGKFLLKEFLQNESVDVVCLVRGESNSVAITRLEKIVNTAGILRESLEKGRLTVFAGDVAKDGLGLERCELDTIQNRVTDVVHSAAEVNVVSSYQQLFASNVTGTANVLNLVAGRKNVNFHYVSTLSVFVGSDQNFGSKYESEDLSKIKRIYGGYAQSKWASEFLVDQLSKDLPIRSIFRLGLLTTDLNCGEIPNNDLLTLVIRTICKLGCFPATSESIRFDATPVDHSAKVIASIVLAGSSDRRKRFHIANSKSVSYQQLTDAIQSVDPEAKKVSKEHFCRRLEQLESSERFLVRSALSRILNGKGDSPCREIDLFQATGVEFDCSETRRRIVEIGASDELKSVPIVTDSYLEKMIREMTKKGPTK